MNRLLILVTAGCALLVILAGAIATAGLIKREESFDLSDEQLADLGLEHWTALERWAFSRMRAAPGEELVLGDFDGQAGSRSRSLSPRFLHDVLDLGTGLDGTGLVGLNLNGAAIRGDLDLSGRHLDFLRLVGTTISGSLALSDAVVRPAPGVAVSGDIVLWNVSLAGMADFANVQAGDITVTGLEGPSFVLLSGARARSITIAESYGFDLLAVLRAKVQGDFVIREVELGSDLVLQGLSARSVALEDLKIGGQLDGVGIVADGDVLLSHVAVAEELILSSSAFGGDLVAEEAVIAKSVLTDVSLGGVSRLAIQRYSR